MNEEIQVRARGEHRDLAQLLRGFLMGSADIVPGVSGGTVALILGIYERLVTAISRVDGHLLTLLAKRQWTAAAEYLDLRFLIGLAAGIALGIGSLASLMHYLLTNQRSYTLSAFFGLILASSLLVGKMVGARRGVPLARALAAGLLAAGLAYWLVGLEQLQGSESPGYFFLCGTLAICAMILPGVSGAYILWMLGSYVHVTGIIKSMIHLEASSRDLMLLAFFAFGCGVGLIGFAKLLKWLLANAHQMTMAVLCGFMIGSLRKMWPFQVDLTPAVEELKLKRFENAWPSSWGTSELLCVGLAVAALVGVIAIESMASRPTSPSSQ